MGSYKWSCKQGNSSYNPYPGPLETTSKVGLQDLGRMGLQGFEQVALGLLPSV